jgi:hypothetical protein
MVAVIKGNRVFIPASSMRAGSAAPISPAILKARYESTHYSALHRRATEKPLPIALLPFFRELPVWI